ncbi:MAG: hypothetical protein AVDCRST_MAG56-5337, partial [uncultured Cytophagales bacterium]
VGGAGKPARQARKSATFRVTLFLTLDGGGTWCQSQAHSAAAPV